ncbi:MAG: DUF4145 domain-containing protein [Desulfovibrionaceae bacterium]|nr:DUF4145 domain-containing protein [Desulfovibrionaceae bacterium]
MLYFEGTCPHCHSDKGFLAFGLSMYTIGEYDYSHNTLEERKILEEKRKHNPQTLFSLAGECLSCHTPVVATCAASLNIRDEIKQCIQVADKTLDPLRRPDVLQIFPQPAQPYAHPSLPDNVRESFIDLQSMVFEKKRPPFIIMGCRAVLEAAVRNLGGDGNNLYERIQDLRENGAITKSLADWANIIRRVGNEAAHELAGSVEDARELVDFTKIFLQFTYELPATIAALRK